jgi:hypothetical protein
MSVASLITVNIPKGSSLSVLANGYSAPGEPNVKPDLNCVWQVFDRANYNIEPPSASVSSTMFDGDLGPVPAPSIPALGADTRAQQFKCVNFVEELMCGTLGKSAQ